MVRARPAPPLSRVIMAHKTAAAKVFAAKPHGTSVLSHIVTLWVIAQTTAALNNPNSRYWIDLVHPNLLNTVIKACVFGDDRKANDHITFTTIFAFTRLFSCVNNNDFLIICLLHKFTVFKILFD